VSASTIRRAVGSGALDCELPGWQSMHGRRARTEDIDEGMAGGGQCPRLHLFLTLVPLMRWLAGIFPLAFPSV
jgi:hypothetical protein